MSHKRGHDLKANDKRRAIALERRFIGDRYAPIQYAIDSADYQAAHKLEGFIIRVTKLRWFYKWRSVSGWLMTVRGPCLNCGSSMMLNSDGAPDRCGHPACEVER